MNTHIGKIAPSIFMSSGRCAIRCRQSARAGARFTVIQQIKVIKAKFKDRKLKKGAKSHWIKPDQTKSNRITPGDGILQPPRASALAKADYDPEPALSFHDSSPPPPRRPGTWRT